jgi:hypothetical protein
MTVDESSDSVLLDLCIMSEADRSVDTRKASRQVSCVEKQDVPKPTPSSQ